MYAALLTPTRATRDIPLDILGDIIPFLPKSDLLVWAQVNSSVLSYVRHALYGSLQVDDWDVCNLMKQSSQHLALTKHLHIKHRSNAANPEEIRRFLRILSRFNQLCTFILAIEWNYLKDFEEDDSVYPTFSDLLLSLSSLKRLEIMDISKPWAREVPPYSLFLHQALVHPALYSLTFESCQVGLHLFNGAPKSSPLASLRVSLSFLSLLEWKALSCSLDLTQMRHFAVHWTCSNRRDAEHVLSDKLRGVFNFPSLTNFFFEGDVEDSSTVFSHFASIQHLTIVLPLQQRTSYTNLATIISEINSDTLQTIRVHIPEPWASVAYRYWDQFFITFRRFTNLHSATIFFDKTLYPTSPPMLMSQKQKRKFVNSMRTKSLLPKNIHIVEDVHTRDSFLLWSKLN
ncbi:hypothetical protein DL96DRAFT_1628760 [Flagelloscypha sp. PMI_526]|nr:hypothetical protein DL96DRAFT_1628760 [Flagelloscypha sp. PMI_526]